MTLINVTNISNYNVYHLPAEFSWVTALAFFCWIIDFLCAFTLAIFIRLELSGSLGPYRTLVNRLAAWNNLMAICFFIFVQNVEFSRVIFGPLPYWICQLSYTTRGIIASTFANIAVTITVTKFMIIRIWKRVPIMDDNLLAFFLITWASLIAALSHLVKMYLPGRYTFNEIHCIGVYLEPWDNIPSKYQIEAFTFGIPLVLHLTLIVYLTKYKWNNQSIHATPDHSHSKSLGSLLGNGIFLVCLFAATLLVSKLNLLGPSQWEVFPYDIYMVSYKHILPTLSFIAMTILQASSIKKDLFSYLLKKIQDFFMNITLSLLAVY